MSNQDFLLSGDVLENGRMLRSINGKFTLHMQMDGNLVVKEGNTPIRDSKTKNRGHQPFKLKMQEDNNLCIYDWTDTCTWASQTSGPGKAGAWAILKVYNKIYSNNL